MKSPYKTLSYGHLAVSSGQTSNEQLLMHSCSLRGKQIKHNESAEVTQSRRRERKTEASILSAGSLLPLFVPETPTEDTGGGQQDCQEAPH